MNASADVTRAVMLIKDIVSDELDSVQMRTKNAMLLCDRIADIFVMFDGNQIALVTTKKRVQIQASTTILFIAPLYDRTLK